jgi:hypothetical protein
VPASPQRSRCSATGAANKAGREIPAESHDFAGAIPSLGENLAARLATREARIYLSPRRLGKAMSTTLNDLADCLVHAGVDGKHVRTIKRYLHEAGILPPTARSNRAQIEAVHAVALLVGCVVHEHQIHAVEATLTAWRLRETASSERHEDPSGNLLHRAANVRLGATTFGRTLTGIVSDTAAALLDSRSPSELCSQVFVWRGSAYAQIQFQDRLQDYRLHFRGTRLRYLAPPTDRIAVTAKIPWKTLLSLARLVAASRQLAVERGITIEQDSTWAALEPSTPTEPNSEQDTAPTSETTEAVEEPPSTASGTDPASHASASSTANDTLSLQNRETHVTPGLSHPDQRTPATWTPIQPK